MKKKKLILPWAITSGVFVTVCATATILAATSLNGLLSALGSRTPIYKAGEESAYNAKYATQKEAADAGKEVNLEVCEEGMVLLKNKDNALPLAKGGKVSVFGKNSVNPAIGGSGSGAAQGDAATIIYDSLSKAGFECNPKLQEFYKSKASGDGRSSNPGDLDSGKPVFLETGETPQSSYTAEVKSSYASYNDAAIVIITRIGGEGFDLPMSMDGATGAHDKNDHFLQLDQNETDLLKAVCEADFKHVIVVLNSGSPMELAFLKDSSYYAYQEKIDGAIWMGYTGQGGMDALGEILNGEVNPSGRTVDTFATHFKDAPSYQNVSINNITSDSNGMTGDQYGLKNGDSVTKKLYYGVDYEEGEYVGYRYYETRGETDGDDWYNKNVVYPFGYGLSYTNFTWEITEAAPSELTEDEFEVKVRVTNTGTVAGKDVVEAYMAAPYIENQIEKPSEQLVAFAKTKLLEPGEHEELTLTVDPYYFASYDAKDMNANGFKGYELDAGSYELRISKNAHNAVLKQSMTLADNIQFEEDNVTGTTVENLYTDQEDSNFDSDMNLKGTLSRMDWEGTWPSTPTEAERAFDQSFFDALDDRTTNNPNNYDDDFDYPDYDMEGDMTVYKMLYKDGEFQGHVDYDDPRWDDLINQMDISSAANMYNKAAYIINKVDSVGLPVIRASDGPVGWTNFMNKDLYIDCCSYASDYMIASTWNVDLVEKVGEAVGEEGLTGKDNVPFTCWYAPAMNIHRSPFGGRTFEYYSEDPFLSGKIGAAEVRGAQSKGVITFIKHFAVNEQETHRSISGDCSWLTEQSLREIYLRPFEIAVKEGGAMGVMSSFNRIGTRWTGGDYRLLTTILREEWGFRGAVITDFNTVPSYMDPKMEVYAGGDLNLATMPNAFWSVDESSTGDVICLKNAVKNVCYVIANSNAMKGTVIGYNKAWWEKLIIGIDIGVGAAVVLSGGVVLFFCLRKKPEEAK